MEGFVSFEVPYPPSANRIWRTFRGRQIKSAYYRAWQKDAVALIRRAPRTEGPFELLIEAWRPDNRRRDLDNLTKPLMDLLTCAGIIADDCNAMKITSVWREGIVKGGKVVVWVKAL